MPAIMEMPKEMVLEKSDKSNFPPSTNAPWTHVWRYNIETGGYIYSHRSLQTNKQFMFMAIFSNNVTLLM